MCRALSALLEDTVKFRVMYLDPEMGNTMCCHSVHRTREEADRALQRMLDSEPMYRYGRIWERDEEWEDNPDDLPY